MKIDKKLYNELYSMVYNDRPGRIKLLRERTGIDLLSAKHLIDRTFYGVSTKTDEVLFPDNTPVTTEYIRIVVDGKEIALFSSQEEMNKATFVFKKSNMLDCERAVDFLSVVNYCGN